ncbi:tRNA (guanine-n(7)-)-methyltransferase [Anaeramoeba flamelloides]|uniref:tRNA (guanine-N(7)-)-methyltransferase n=1 Tax=Anaeramoeba flamelloides TaxID=1746091 RepID=A0ABQ8XZH0_9EUKA|nr:tRNA (guanine-n(7)-)-methyltransferase [Anaeramoeba flamelloides]
MSNSKTNQKEEIKDQELEKEIEKNLIEEEKESQKENEIEKESQKETENDPNKKKKLPKMTLFRQKAHMNPLSLRQMDFNLPLRPQDMNWKETYPNMKQGEHIDFADIGCGYGGLLFKLSEMFPDNYSIGLEIRKKVCNYVKEKIIALRHNEKGKYLNVSALQTNAMRTLPHLFAKSQLSKIFFLFPDPEFKKRKIKWRIISQELLAEYAYFMKSGGIIYTITDVYKLHSWMKGHLEEHPLFTELTKEEYQNDPLINVISTESEEAKRVEKNGGTKFLACFKRK